MQWFRGVLCAPGSFDVGAVFEHPTYVVMELPASAGNSMLDIRTCDDARLAAFPAEITIAGPSPSNGHRGGEGLGP